MKLYLRQISVLCFSVTGIFVDSFIHNRAQAESKCLELSCFYTPQGGMGIRGHAKEGFAPDSRDYKKIPIVFWGQDLKIIFIKENTVDKTTAQKVIKEFINGMNGLHLFSHEIDIAQYNFNSVKADQIDKDFLNFNTRPEDYFSLGKSRYRNLSISIYSYVLSYNDEADLDFLEVKLSPFRLEVDPVSGKRSAVRQWVTHSYNFPAPLGPNIFISLNDKSISILPPRNIHKTYERERYILNGHINQSGCHTSSYVDSIERLFVTVLLYLSVEWSSPKDCLPLLFGIPLPYQEAAPAFDKLLNLQKNEPEDTPLRVEDLLK